MAAQAAQAEVAWVAEQATRAQAAREKAAHEAAVADSKTVAARVAAEAERAAAEQLVAVSTASRVVRSALAEHFERRMHGLVERLLGNRHPEANDPATWDVAAKERAAQAAGLLEMAEQAQRRPWRISKASSRATSRL